MNSTTIKYRVSVACDRNTKNFTNVKTDCHSRFPETDMTVVGQLKVVNGMLEVDTLDQLHKLLKKKKWQHHGWDYWRCPSCEEKTKND